MEDEDDEDVIIKVIPFMDGWLAWVIVATVIVICLVACVMARIFYTCCGDKKRELSYDEEVSSSELIDKKKQKKSFASTFDEYSSIRVSTKTKNHMLRVTNSCPNVNDTILGYVLYRVCVYAMVLCTLIYRVKSPRSPNDRLLEYVHLYPY